MNLKNFITLVALSSSVAFTTFSCKSKISDADLKAKVETVVSNTSGVTVDVKDGVVTLSGIVSSESEREAIENSAKAVDANNVKSVINNIVVEVPQVDINTNDADLSAKVVDAIKDFPNAKATVKDGIITVTGSVEQSRLIVLKQSLDALSPKKVDLSAVVTN